jgi:hypothetical protein
VAWFHRVSSFSHRLLLPPPCSDFDTFRVSLLLLPHLSISSSLFGI